MYRQGEDKIRNLLESDAYLGGSLEERRVLVTDLLVELERERLIEQWNYVELIYTFSYEYVNGVYGGLRIKDYSAQPGDIPMN